ncbi:alpha-amylase, partial [bacterium]|nr:alpha-amylase [bacterium]
VAKRFPIIRFDVVMTFVKKHFHRFWFPELGEGGDIPSRSWFGMTWANFDDLVPVEFWREVVERIARDAPDTLLLAEAFWLMEGYFVRSLGMHRVYNSAFMNMLRTEDNQNYRLVIKNTIEFDPEILKRYVNFMNNPDEDPAVTQFGKGDKYFGVCAMMSTLPGLPMFGHGQFEGFEEKYGMEYRRSYWNEKLDDGLIAHHERIISPILHHRKIFSGSDQFRLFDFFSHNGQVNENVFAYSNQFGDSKGLFVFNNTNKQASGTIHTSASWNDKSATGDELRHETLAESLQFSGREDRFILLKDLITQRWYIRRSSLIAEHGFSFELKSYQCHVFIDIKEIDETVDKKYETIEKYLQGGGCRSVEDAWLDMQNQSLYAAFKDLFSETIIGKFDQITNKMNEHTDKTDCGDLSDFEDSLIEASEILACKITEYDTSFDAAKIRSMIRTNLEIYLSNIRVFLARYITRDRLLILWHGIVM